ncbi:HD-GYP domain-containing protein [Novosphingobium sp. KACC 22771]|uniref:HD-GYP domain-containing protein n=1 Tax=Novosphingobium sp. KACC 22771 TaxID=3025670 RepID=UPI002366B561|nr:HD domain-containing phosphohydrolase [Novosphingobium sp. KACC 22771]WDF70885.1 HD domain-containing protein [Novosphingobium sp. KACC 22771]
MRHALPSDFDIAASDSTSLSEILGAFSYALDLTEGQPEGHSLRSCWIASRIAQTLGLCATERRNVYYATLLKDLGCSSNAARIAEIYLADDRSFKHDYKLVQEGLGPTLRFVFSRTGPGHSFAARARAIATILKDGTNIAHDLILTRCTRGADIARRLRFPEAVAGAIAALDEHWDGGGKPQGVRGDAIPLAARLALLAQVADVFQKAGGPEAALAEVAARRGTWFDPELVDAFLRIATDPAFWRDVNAPTLEARIGAFEPEDTRITVDEDYLDDIAEAFGAVIDAKSPYTGGHSGRVGYYAHGLGEAMGMSPQDVRHLRRAAILHDVGKLAVSSRVLEKPGKLDDVEWIEMRSHAMHTMEILSRIGPLRDMASVAAAHHERLDGKGYPLGLGQMLIAPEARIITVCDFYDALTADRPYRAAMPVEKALSIIESEVGKAVDGTCVDALRAMVMNEAEQPIHP